MALSSEEIAQIGAQIEKALALLNAQAAASPATATSAPGDLVEIQRIAAGHYADEAMSTDGIYWYVSNFQINDWSIIDTSQFIGNRRAVCGVNAVIESFRWQYPGIPGEFGNEAPARLLQRLDILFSRPCFNAWDDEIDQLVHQWTRGKYRIVVVDPSGKAARRVTRAN